MEGTKGPIWDSDPGGAPYMISYMWDVYGIDEVVDPMIEHIHSIGEL